jgi:hypothetical protein
MSESKTVTIRLPAETYDKIRKVCGELGDAYNFNQFVNQSLSSTLDIIDHDSEHIPVPAFAMMARFMKSYKAATFSSPGIAGNGNTNGEGQA